MPIVQTPVVTGTPISRAAVDANLGAVEQYLKGNIPGSDLSAAIGTVSRVDGQNLLAYTPKPYEIGLSTRWSRHSGRLNHRNRLDEEGTLDFCYYGDPWHRPQVGLGLDITNPCGMNAKGWQGGYVFERLGNVPVAQGGGRALQRMVWSWNNWRWNFTAPAWASTNQTAYYDLLFERFPVSEYWDAWKTVPYASAKIYVPEACMLMVQGWARGTWNMVGHLNGAIDKEWTNLHNRDDAPTVFRLFIDQAHRPDSRPFEWESNGVTYNANWAPVQTHAEVGQGLKGGVLTNKGSEWMASTWPRGAVRCVSEVYVPAAGYYTISLRYNSLHYIGHTEYTGPGSVWDWKSHCAPLGTNTSGVASPEPTFGLNLVSRFEASGIQAVAQLGRTAQSNDASSSQFT